MPEPFVIAPAKVESVAAVEVSVMEPAASVVIVPPEEPESAPSVTDRPLRSSVPLVIVAAPVTPKPFALPSVI